MKKIYLLSALMSLSIISSAQYKLDSLFNIVVNSKVDSSRIEALYQIIEFTYGYMPTDSILYYAQKLTSTGKEINYPPAEAFGYASTAFGLIRLDHKVNALENCLKALKIAEEYRHTEVLAFVYDILGLIYPSDDPNRLNYFFKGLELLENDIELRAVLLGNIGETYLNNKIFDSAWAYLQRSYQLMTSLKITTELQSVLTSLGEIQLQLGNPELAYTYHKMAMKNAFNPTYTVDSYNGIIDFFEKTSATDSAFIYNNMLLGFATKHNNFKWMIKPCWFTYEYYKKRNQTDSALKYLELYTSSKKEADSREKTSRLMALTFAEDQRQNQLAAANEKIRNERAHNLQYAAIAVGLISFIILFFMFSRSIIVKERFIKFCGILALLAVFEFINLYIHPHLAHLTNDSPVLMLAVLMCIAALLVPLHHRLEKWITRVMVEKNKKIRLAAAKKTIARLEADLQ
jgi:tetratricopeptide (TPR) repeat protein